MQSIEPQNRFERSRRCCACAGDRVVRNALAGNCLGDNVLTRTLLGGALGAAGEAVSIAAPRVIGSSSGALGGVDDAARAADTAAAGEALNMIGRSISPMEKRLDQALNPILNKLSLKAISQ